MPTPCTPDHIEQLLQELENANDRSVIIVGSVFLEKYLAKYIKKYLPRPSSKYASEMLFSDGNGFRSFKTKIFWAYSTGIIGPKTQEDLDTIREIRNTAMNDMRPITFRDEVIAERCRMIRCIRRNMNINIEILNPRDIYIRALQVLLLAIVDKINDAENADPLPDIMET